MTLDGLETELKAQFPRHKGQKVHMVRFADDFIVTGSNPETLEQEIKPLIERFLRERGLQLSQRKPALPTLKQVSISSAKTYINTATSYSSSPLRKTSKHSSEKYGRLSKGTSR